MQTNTSITVTIPNPTAGQLAQITDLMNAAEQNSTAQAASSTPKKSRSTRKTPEPTVSPDEDENFGTSAIDEEELNDDDAPSDEEDEEETSGVTFDQVKTLLDRYGAKKPNAATALLKSFDINTTKELRSAPKKWEAVYRKLNSALASLKKAN